MKDELPEEDVFSIPDPDDALLLEGDEFQAAFGESLEQTLNLDTWRPGEDLPAMYERLEQEVASAVEQADRTRSRIRDELFPRAFGRPTAPPGAGLYRVDPPTLERVHRGLLFNGSVEACDGTSVMHDSLPLTIAQIGVSLVSYQGDQGTWVQRLFRRDLRMGSLDPVDEAIALLERRSQRDGADPDTPSARDKLSDLSRRGIMTYAERAILLHRSDAMWRIGHGNPVAYELLTGGGLVVDGDMPLLRRSLKIWRELLVGHKKWVFVPSKSADRLLLTLGDALLPLEFALVDTPLRVMRAIVEGHLPRSTGLKSEARQFVEEVGPQIVTGVYRASRASPAYTFYAHRDYAHEAALIAMADSVLQEHRGFPMLIDLADTICRASFGADSLTAGIQQAYIEAGVPFRYLGERDTRS
ncbi:MAG TPA: hypothetical protein VEX13_01425 [Chloroflexia bacterium]|nr:hypothetical protein [Chloroflexia bacterium]